MADTIKRILIMGKLFEIEPCRTCHIILVDCKGCGYKISIPKDRINTPIFCPVCGTMIKRIEEGNE